MHICGSIVNMQNNESSSLNIKKVEGDNNLPTYETALQQAIEHYAVTDGAFNNPKQIVIEGACRLLSGYEVDPLFVDIPERNLFALCIADRWLSTKKIREKKALLDILKLVAVGVKKDLNYGTLSNKVRVLSEHGNPRGSHFDPEASIANSHNEYIDMLSRYIVDNQDEAKTVEVTKMLQDWSETSKLSGVRKKLQIQSPQEERSFNVIVLNKTAQEMADDLGYTSLYLSRGGQFTVVFNSDYQLADSLEHEYAHSQSDGLSVFYQHLLFRGVNEALTEGSKPNPATYPDQRAFLNLFLEKNPTYEDLLYKAYVGDETARKQIFSMIVNDYGLEAFLTFARVAPIDNPKMSGVIGESIYIAPKLAISLMESSVTS